MPVDHAYEANQERERAAAHQVSVWREEARKAQRKLDTLLAAAERLILVDMSEDDTTQSTAYLRALKDLHAAVSEAKP